MCLHLFLWNLLYKRIDDEDDETAVIEQDIQRLVIVTQVLLSIIYVHILNFSSKLGHHSN